MNNGFLDLRGRPELAREVVEAQASGYLPDLLAALAADASRWFSVGCDLGCSGTPDGQIDAGGYIQIAPSDLVGDGQNQAAAQSFVHALWLALNAAVGVRTWGVEVLIRQLETSGIGGPGGVWSAVIDFHGIGKNLQEAGESAEMLIDALHHFLADRNAMPVPT